MTEATITRLPKSRAELRFDVTPEDAKPYLDAAVNDISTKQPLKGFRPGKATYEDVKRAYGEMRIWETALERVVRAWFVKTVLDKELNTVGSPEISVEQLVPNQNIRFTATVTLAPEVTRLAAYDKPLVKRKQKAVTEEQVDKTLEDLRRMRRTEAVVDRPAGREDLAVIDLEIRKDDVVVDGGVTKDYRVYLNEEHYIPGFAEKLIGAKKGDVLTFDLAFPKDHYNKQLAGASVTFVVTVKDVFELRLPELNDAFAASLGQETLPALRALLSANLQREEDERADESAEIELLQKLVNGSAFGEIPDLLVNEEVRRMIKELEASAEERGMKLDDYLKSIKRTPDELRMDFIPRAIERIRTALLVREIAKRERIEVSDEEAAAEQDRLLGGIKESDKETRDLVASPEYRDYISTQLRNRKVIELLKHQAIEG